MGEFSFVLRLGVPGDLDEVLGLVHEAAEWLQSKNTDQWQQPWPDPDTKRERVRTDLNKGKTWLMLDGQAAVATITIDNDQPLDLLEQAVWPADTSLLTAIYVRRVVVSRDYSGLGLGAALLDWAAVIAKRDHGAHLIRVDVWTTNTALHRYYRNQGFIRRYATYERPAELYPSQALFERPVDPPEGLLHKDFTELFTILEGEAAGRGFCPEYPQP